MGVLYLTEAEVDRLIGIQDAIPPVEEAFRRLAAGTADNVPRVRARGRGITVHSMSAVADYLSLAGWKNYTTTRLGAQFLVGLHDAETGRLAALIEADRLGQLRTGATTAVAVKRMASPDTTELGLFGTGKQARTQLEAICTVCSIRKAFVYSRSEQHRLQFAEEMAARLGIEVLAVHQPQDAAEDLPIVVTATTSPVPVFLGAALSEGTLVCAIGSNWPGRAEIDSDVVRRADNIVCDSIEACRREAGDFADALEKGIFDWSQAVELSSVVTSQAIGRSRPESIAVFKSVGLAIEDVALAAAVLERAREQAVGRQLDL